MATMTDVYNDPKARLMMEKLCEGDLGGYFDVYRLVGDVDAATIILDATRTYEAHRIYWNNEGAFAQNYLETVGKMMQCIVAAELGPLPTKGELKEEVYEVVVQGWYCIVFERFAQFTRNFTHGDGAEF